MPQNMFIDPLKNMSSYNKLLAAIESKISPISIHGLSEENIGHLAYGLNKHTQRQILIITSDEIKAKKIFEDLKNFDNNFVGNYPSRDLVFYDIDAFSYETTHERIKVLSRLNDDENIVVVTYLEALLNKVMSSNIFDICTEELKYGEVIDLDNLLNAFVTKGYERVNMVEGKGQFSLRGGIIDFFPVNSENPYRI